MQCQRLIQQIGGAGSREIVETANGRIRAFELSDESLKREGYQWANIGLVKNDLPLRIQKVVDLLSAVQRRSICRVTPAGD